MTTIYTRAGNGAALTHSQMDANFNNLNNDKIEFATGTKMVFYQSLAPTGWTIDSAITTTGMIIVDQANGGTSGGTDDPKLMDKVPSHTHTTDAQGQHTHTIPYAASAGSSGYPGFDGSGDARVSAQSSSDGNHSHNVLANTGASNWVPRYNAVIVCSKN